MQDLNEKAVVVVEAVARVILAAVRAQRHVRVQRHQPQLPVRPATTMVMKLPVHLQQQHIVLPSGSLGCFPGFIVARQREECVLLSQLADEVHATMCYCLTCLDRSCLYLQTLCGICLLFRSRRLDRGCVCLPFVLVETLYLAEACNFLLGACLLNSH
ncbi:hypothetical protein JG687_00015317 [Phytophthora cactorum]|uniref:Uncharacterized protein n=1 Tax=Phytophthora cactorum TaxID=29920 RepID=A0A8T1TWJ9_9STRA|nr:hypothetical protein JG687_00015317 [Phytophthora cactorum]